VVTTTPLEVLLNKVKALELEIAHLKELIANLAAVISSNN